MKFLIALASVFFSGGLVRAQAPEFPNTVCSISYGGTPQSPTSEFAGKQGISGSDADYSIGVLFYSASAEVRITEKSTGRKFMMMLAVSELGSFKSPVALFSSTGEGVFLNCRALKVLGTP